MRVLGWIVIAYLVVAVGTRLAEAAGLHRCGCAEGCWCRHRFLSVFRWVLPLGHSSLDAETKEALRRAC